MVWDGVADLGACSGQISFCIPQQDERMDQWKVSDCTDSSDCTESFKKVLMVAILDVFEQCFDDAKDGMLWKEDVALRPTCASTRTIAPTLGRVVAVW